MDGYYLGFHYLHSRGCQGIRDKAFTAPVYYTLENLSCWTRLKSLQKSILMVVDNTGNFIKESFLFLTFVVKLA